VLLNFAEANFTYDVRLRNQSAGVGGYAYVLSGEAVDGANASTLLDAVTSPSLFLNGARVPVPPPAGAPPPLQPVWVAGPVPRLTLPRLGAALVVLPGEATDLCVPEATY
jgi:hypothetical protein